MRLANRPRYSRARPKRRPALASWFPRDFPLESLEESSRYVLMIATEENRNDPVAETYFRFRLRGYAGCVHARPRRQLAAVAGPNLRRHQQGNGLSHNVERYAEPHL